MQTTLPEQYKFIVWLRKYLCNPGPTLEEDPYSTMEFDKILNDVGSTIAAIRMNEESNTSISIPEEKIKEKINELLTTKFRQEKYQRNSIYHKIIQVLSRGGDALHLMEQLLDIIDTQQDKIKELLEKETGR